MTRKEILNTPEIVDFMIDKSVMVESKMKLHKRLDELCKLAIEALDQEPCEDCISREHLLKEIASLKESPWFKDNTNGAMAIRKEAIEIVEDLCIRKEPSVNPQPCEDAISRQAVLDLLENTNNGWIINKVLRLPSVNPQEQKWIPVSERLPEDRKEKLVYLSSNRITIAKYSSGMIRLAPYKSMGWGYEPKYHFIDFETEEVIAWMPLPEPYKAESKTEQELAYADQDTLMSAT